MNDKMIEELAKIVCIDCGNSGSPALCVLDLCRACEVYAKAKKKAEEILSRSEQGEKGLRDGASYIGLSELNYILSLASSEHERKYAAGIERMAYENAIRIHTPKDEPLENTKRMKGNKHYSISYTISIMDNFAGQLLWAKCEPTYALAEAEARAYLNARPNAKGGK